MKILIAYATRGGTSREGAELLASLLPNHEVTLADLAVQTPDPTQFDYLVLGGAVLYGKAHKALRKYLKRYEREIAARERSLFLCCAVAEQVENYFERSVSPTLLEGAQDLLYFGGDLSLARFHGLDRLLVRMVRSSIKDSEDADAMLPGFLPEHVRMLADRLRQK